MVSGYFEWTEARIADAQALRGRGLTCRDISERFGVSKNAVVAMFRRESVRVAAAAALVAKGVATPEQAAVAVRKKPRRQREDYLPHLQQAEAEGVSLRAAAKAMGLPQPLAWRWMNEARADAAAAVAAPKVGAIRAVPPVVSVDTSADASADASVGSGGGAPGASLSPLDAAILADGSTWAGRAAIAARFSVPVGVVLCRFHRLRVAA